MLQITNWKILTGTALLVFAAAACSKKQVAVAPPPPAPVAAAPARATPPPPERRQQPAPAPVAQNNTPRYPDAATRARIDELIARILNADSKELGQILQQYPTYKLRVEGFCDERGSAEYNEALGDARAKAAKEYLVSVGVPANQLDTVSFGKEQQLCNEHDEACWQKNRRVHIVAEGNGG